MKTVLLMRHAKSSWKDHKLPDMERPLSKRGKKDAPRIGSLLKDKELVPQQILSSPAIRAKMTAVSVAEKSGFKGTIDYVENFYLAEPGIYEDALKSLSDDTERVMLIGHNPGMEGLVQILSGQVESLPTGALAYIVIPIKHWSEIDGSTRGEIIQLWRPRELKEKSK
ncbi:MAG: histidine phosphatase family protein [Anaerolineaceae bacterium]|nr:histidine phosphatase family protein [Anaerolineaceae bacterium]